MSDNNDSRLRKAGRTAWRILFPFAAMWQSMTLAKEELLRTKENLGVLKDLGKRAREVVAEDGAGTPLDRDIGFEAAMQRRSRSAMSCDELYAFFLKKKRFALGTGAIFALLGLYAVAGGIWYGHMRGIALGSVSLLASQPVFFMVALGAQLRLWQLRTRRLSREERGGLGDFMREVKGWWWVTLNPEFGRARS